MRTPSPKREKLSAPAAAFASGFLPLTRSSWTTGGSACTSQSRPPERRPLRRPPARPHPPPRWRAVFDFVRKAADEQKLAFDALKAGRLSEYAADKVKRDLESVQKVNDGLTKSREKLARDLGAIMGNTSIIELERTLEDLEEVLITSDLGVDTVDKVIADLRRLSTEEGLKTAADVKAGLKESIVGILESKGMDLELGRSESGPTVVMVIGANGMGKTTTIGKLATRLRGEGNSVLIAACDTFRAAAVEQVAEWADRAGADIVKPGSTNAKPSSVLFSASERALKEEYDYLIVDTSGRLHTNANLMSELQKMGRVLEKFFPNGADETLLVVDASIGRNAVTQARVWRDAVGVTGLVVTKLDGTARAGFVVSVVDELDIPVKLIGVGEGVDDLREFDAGVFADGLVG